MSMHQDSWSVAIQAWYNVGKDWRYGVGSVNGAMVGQFMQVAINQRQLEDDILSYDLIFNLLSTDCLGQF